MTTRETTSWLFQYKANKRYKLKHLAEDIGVSYAMMHRFVNKKNVGQEFFVKWFNFFLT